MWKLDTFFGPSFLKGFIMMNIFSFVVGFVAVLIAAHYLSCALSNIATLVVGGPNFRQLSFRRGYAQLVTLYVFEKAGDYVEKVSNTRSRLHQKLKHRANYNRQLVSNDGDFKEMRWFPFFCGTLISLLIASFFVYIAVKLWPYYPLYFIVGLAAFYSIVSFVVYMRMTSEINIDAFIEKCQKDFGEDYSELREFTKTFLYKELVEKMEDVGTKLPVPLKPGVLMSAPLNRSGLVDLTCARPVDLAFAYLDRGVTVAEQQQIRLFRANWYENEA